MLGLDFGRSQFLLFAVGWGTTATISGALRALSAKTKTFRIQGLGLRLGDWSMSRLQ